MAVEKVDPLAIAASKSVAGLRVCVACGFVQIPVQLQHVGEAVSAR